MNQDRPRNYSENIKDAVEVVRTWPEWKAKNISAVFSERDISVPGSKEQPIKSKRELPDISL